MNELCQSVELYCPDCKRAIVDVKFHAGGNSEGRISIEHELPICQWWATKEARAWAIALVTDIITSTPDAEA